MTHGAGRQAAILFLGDIVVFFVSLWLTLIFRFGFTAFSETLHDHVLPFSFLFAIWLLVFYMAGLYGKRIVFFKSALVGAIFKVQLLNIVFAALFFFFAPGIGITPKTTLLLYLAVSLILIFLWRLFLFPRLSKPSAREKSVLIADGSEALELMKEVNGNPRYHLEFVMHIAPGALVRDFGSFSKQLAEHTVTNLVVDMEHDALRPELARIYELAFVKKEHHILDFYHVYEEVFDRVPLSLLQPGWFLKNISQSGFHFFDAVKRLIDIVGALVMGAVTIFVTPFIFVAMRIEGPGPLFISQERLGRFGTRMRAYKFRSMKHNKSASKEWTIEEKKDNPITRVGGFLRMTSLDEFPQFINILTGELSLIGPRNDVEGLGVRLGEAIPYYGMRYVVKPGITGWAQINQQYEQGNISPQSIEETKTRLAYDFYYIKNRSLSLDIVIALKTVKRMLFRVSSW